MSIRNIRMLTSQKELIEKERMKHQGDIKARRDQEKDTSDVARKTNTSEAARTAKKAKKDAFFAGKDQKLAETKAKFAAIGAAIGGLNALAGIAFSAAKLGGAGKNSKKKAQAEADGSKTKKQGRKDGKKAKKAAKKEAKASGKSNKEARQAGKSAKKEVTSAAKAEAKAGVDKVKSEIKAEKQEKKAPRKAGKTSKVEGKNGSDTNLTTGSEGPKQKEGLNLGKILKTIGAFLGGGPETDESSSEGDKKLAKTGAIGAAAGGGLAALLSALIKATSKESQAASEIANATLSNVGSVNSKRADMLDKVTDGIGGALSDLGKGIKVAGKMTAGGIKKAVAANLDKAGFSQAADSLNNSKQAQFFDNATAEMEKFSGSEELVTKDVEAIESLETEKSEIQTNQNVVEGVSSLLSEGGDDSISLSDDQIDNIVEESGLTGDDAKNLKDELKGQTKNTGGKISKEKALQILDKSGVSKEKLTGIKDNASKKVEGGASRVKEIDSEVGDLKQSLNNRGKSVTVGKDGKVELKDALQLKREAATNLKRAKRGKGAKGSGGENGANFESSEEAIKSLTGNVKSFLKENDIDVKELGKGGVKEISNAIATGDVDKLSKLAGGTGPKADAAKLALQSLEKGGVSGASEAIATLKKGGSSFNSAKGVDKLNGGRKGASNIRTVAGNLKTAENAVSEADNIEASVSQSRYETFKKISSANFGKKDTGNVAGASLDIKNVLNNKELGGEDKSKEIKALVKKYGAETVGKALKETASEEGGLEDLSSLGQEGLKNLAASLKGSNEGLSVLVSANINREDSNSSGFEDLESAGNDEAKLKELAKTLGVELKDGDKPEDIKGKIANKIASNAGVELKGGETLDQIKAKVSETNNTEVSANQIFSAAGVTSDTQKSKVLAGAISVGGDQKEALVGLATESLSKVDPKEAAKILATVDPKEAAKILGGISSKDIDKGAEILKSLNDLSPEKAIQVAGNLNISEDSFDGKSGKDVLSSLLGKASTGENNQKIGKDSALVSLFGGEDSAKGFLTKEGITNEQKAAFLGGLDLVGGDKTAKLESALGNGNKSEVLGKLLNDLDPKASANLLKNLSGGSTFSKGELSKALGDLGVNKAGRILAQLSGTKDGAKIAGDILNSSSDLSNDKIAKILNSVSADAGSRIIAGLSESSNDDGAKAIDVLSKLDSNKATNIISSLLESGDSATVDTLSKQSGFKDIVGGASNKAKGRFLAAVSELTDDGSIDESSPLKALDKNNPLLKAAGFTDENGNLNTDQIAKALSKVDPEEAAKFLGKVGTEDAAKIIGKIGTDKAVQILDKLDAKTAGSILSEGIDGDGLSDKQSLKLLNKLNKSDVTAEALGNLSPEKAKEVFGNLDDNLKARVITSAFNDGEISDTEQSLFKNLGLVDAVLDKDGNPVLDKDGNAKFKINEEKFVETLSELDSSSAAFVLGNLANLESIEGSGIDSGTSAKILNGIEAKFKETGSGNSAAGIIKNLGSRDAAKLIGNGIASGELNSESALTLLKTLDTDQAAEIVSELAKLDNGEIKGAKGSELGKNILDQAGSDSFIASTIINLDSDALKKLGLSIKSNDNKIEIDGLTKGPKDLNAAILKADAETAADFIETIGDLDGGSDKAKAIKNALASIENDDFRANVIGRLDSETLDSLISTDEGKELLKTTLDKANNYSKGLFLAGLARDGDLGENLDILKEAGFTKDGALDTEKIGKALEEVGVKQAGNFLAQLTKLETNISDEDKNDIKIKEGDVLSIVNSFDDNKFIGFGSSSSENAASVLLEIEDQLGKSEEGRESLAKITKNAIDSGRVSTDDIAKILKNSGDDGRELGKTLLRGLAGVEGKDGTQSGDEIIADILGKTKTKKLLGLKREFGDEDLATYLFAQLNAEQKISVAETGLKNGSLSEKELGKFVSGIVDDEAGQFLGSLANSSGGFVNSKAFQKAFKKSTGVKLEELNENDKEKVFRALEESGGDTEVAIKKLEELAEGESGNEELVSILKGDKKNKGLINQFKLNNQFSKKSEDRDFSDLIDESKLKKSERKEVEKILKTARNSNEAQEELNAFLFENGGGENSELSASISSINSGLETSGNIASSSKSGAEIAAAILKKTDSNRRGDVLKAVNSNSDIADILRAGVKSGEFNERFVARKILDEGAFDNDDVSGILGEIANGDGKKNSDNIRSEARQAKIEKILNVRPDKAQKIENALLSGNKEELKALLGDTDVDVFIDAYTGEDGGSKNRQSAISKIKVVDGEGKEIGSVDPSKAEKIEKALLSGNKAELKSLLGEGANVNSFINDYKKGVGKESFQTNDLNVISSAIENNSGIDLDAEAKNALKGAGESPSEDNIKKLKKAILEGNESEIKSLLGGGDAANSFVKDSKSLKLQKAILSGDENEIKKILGETSGKSFISDLEESNGIATNDTKLINETLSESGEDGKAIVLKPDEREKLKKAVLSGDKNEIKKILGETNGESFIGNLSENKQDKAINNTNENILVAEYFSNALDKSDFKGVLETIGFETADKILKNDLDANGLLSDLAGNTNKGAVEKALAEGNVQALFSLIESDPTIAKALIGNIDINSDNLNEVKGKIENRITSAVLNGNPEELRQLLGGGATSSKLKNYKADDSSKSEDLEIVLGIVDSVKNKKAGSAIFGRFDAKTQLNLIDAGLKSGKLDEREVGRFLGDDRNTNRGEVFAKLTEETEKKDEYGNENGFISEDQLKKVFKRTADADKFLRFGGKESKQLRLLKEADAFYNGTSVESVEGFKKENNIELNSNQEVELQEALLDRGGEEGELQEALSSGSKDKIKTIFSAAAAEQFAKHAGLTDKIPLDRLDDFAEALITRDTSELARILGKTEGEVQEELDPNNPGDNKIIQEIESEVYSKLGSFENEGAKAILGGDSDTTSSEKLEELVAGIDEASKKDKTLVQEKRSKFLERAFDINSDEIKGFKDQTKSDIATLLLSKGNLSSSDKEALKSAGILNENGGVDFKSEDRSNITILGEAFLRNYESGSLDANKAKEVLSALGLDEKQQVELLTEGILRDGVIDNKERDLINSFDIYGNGELGDKFRSGVLNNVLANNTNAFGKINGNGTDLLIDAGIVSRNGKGGFKSALNNNSIGKRNISITDGTLSVNDVSKPEEGSFSYSLGKGPAKSKLELKNEKELKNLKKKISKEIESISKKENLGLDKKEVEDLTNEVAELSKGGKLNESSDFDDEAINAINKNLKDPKSDLGKLFKVSNVENLEDPRSSNIENLDKKFFNDNGTINLDNLIDKGFVTQGKLDSKKLATFIDKNNLDASSTQKIIAGINSLEDNGLINKGAATSLFSSLETPGLINAINKGAETGKDRDLAGKLNNDRNDLLLLINRDSSGGDNTFTAEDLNGLSKSRKEDLSRILGVSFGDIELASTGDGIALSKINAALGTKLSKLNDDLKGLLGVDVVGKDFGFINSEINKKFGKDTILDAKTTAKILTDNVNDPIKLGRKSGGYANKVGLGLALPTAGLSLLIPLGSELLSNIRVGKTGKKGGISSKEAQNILFNLDDNTGKDVLAEIALLDAKKGTSFAGGFLNSGLTANNISQGKVSLLGFELGNLRKLGKREELDRRDNLISGALDFLSKKIDPVADKAIDALLFSSDTAPTNVKELDPGTRSKTSSTFELSSDKAGILSKLAETNSLTLKGLQDFGLIKPTGGLDRTGKGPFGGVFGLFDSKFADILESSTPAQAAKIIKSLQSDPSTSPIAAKLLKDLGDDFASKILSVRGDQSNIDLFNKVSFNINKGLEIDDGLTPDQVNKLNAIQNGSDLTSPQIKALIDMNSLKIEATKKGVGKDVINKQVLANFFIKNEIGTDSVQNDADAALINKVRSNILAGKTASENFGLTDSSDLAAFKRISESDPKNSKSADVLKKLINSADTIQAIVGKKAVDNKAVAKSSLENVITDSQVSDKSTDVAILNQVRTNILAGKDVVDGLTDNQVTIFNTIKADIGNKDNVSAKTLNTLLTNQSAFNSVVAKQSIEKKAIAKSSLENVITDSQVSDKSTDVAILNQVRTNILAGKDVVDGLTDKQVIRFNAIKTNVGDKDNVSAQTLKTLLNDKSSFSPFVLDNVNANNFERIGESLSKGIFSVSDDGEFSFSEFNADNEFGEGTIIDSEERANIISSLDAKQGASLLSGLSDRDVADTINSLSQSNDPKMVDLANKILDKLGTKGDRVRTMLSDSSKFSLQKSEGVMSEEQIGGDKSKQIGGAKGIDSRSTINDILMLFNAGLPGLQFMMEQLDKMKEAMLLAEEAKKKKAAAHELESKMLKYLGIGQGTGDGGGLQAALSGNSGQE